MKKLKYKDVGVDISKYRKILKSTDEVPLKLEIFGQERGLKALEFGLNIESPRFNIYVSGPRGCGKKTSIYYLIPKSKRYKKIPPDMCYVYNFKEADRPILLKLPSGNGKKFKQEIEKFGDELPEIIQKVFEADFYRQKEKEIKDEFKKFYDNFLNELTQEANKYGFTAFPVAGGERSVDFAPIINGKIFTIQEISNFLKAGKISNEDFNKIASIYEKLVELYNKKYPTLREKSEEYSKRLVSLQSSLVEKAIKSKIESIKHKFPFEKISDYLDEMQEYIVSNFKEIANNWSKEKIKFKVNLIVDNSNANNCPVIYEVFPNYSRVIGNIEKIYTKEGFWYTDFTHIKVGSLVKANGGFLILEVEDIISDDILWKELLKALREGKVEIKDISNVPIPGITSLKPEPIDIDVKVILIGPESVYNLLHSISEDFKEVFKVKAEFDEVMDLNKNTIEEYMYFIKNTVQKHSLLTFDKSAVEEVVKYGIKLAGRKDKLSTLFAEIEELIQEANYWAVKRGGKKVVLKDILKAVKEHKNRLNLYEDKLLEYFKKEILRIKVDGEEIGIVNGLAVISTGEYTFGRPVRISARVGLGTAGIINIEREAELSGKIHHKGVLILEGFLKEKFAREVPLVMDATICFEQSYTGVEGDSASSAELYALLSAMAHIPIKQNLAITGSVNQKGEIQAIGGVNEKITGFFNACKIKGFTGNQGVIIPESNIAEVMLDDEISKEIKKGRFHIYAISHIDEGIPLLFGVSAEVLYRRVLNFLKENVLRWRKYMGVGWRR